MQSFVAFMLIVGVGNIFNGTVPGTLFMQLLFSLLGGFAFYHTINIIAFMACNSETA